MAVLTITPGYLAKLAKLQDQASEKSGLAAASAFEISKDLWVTHGVISGHSNNAVTNAEAVRRAAGEALKKVATALAVTLRAADDAYQSTDEQADKTIAHQVLDR